MAAVMIRPELPGYEENLYRNLTRDACLHEKEAEAVYSFLLSRGCMDLGGVDAETLTAYRAYVRERFPDKKHREYYGALLETAVLRFLSPSYKDLESEMEQAFPISRPIANKIKMFLMILGIHRIGQIDYRVRSAFERYLCTCGTSHRLEYVKILDRLKLKAIGQECSRMFHNRRVLSYAPDVIYLGYHPDYETAMSFYLYQRKEELVFDFSLDASETLKRQIFSMLNYSLEKEQSRKIRRELYLVPLQKLYLYCAGNGIGDIERMEEEQTEGFRASMEGKAGTKTDIYMQVVASTRRHLFLSAKDTNWDATVWYLDRFEFKDGRANPAIHIDCFRFTSIKDPQNRSLFQCYMKYLIGLTNMALTSVKMKYYEILDFLSFCGKEKISAAQVSADEIDRYVRFLEEKGISGETFNKALSAVASFYAYLCTKNLVRGVPFRFDYYRKKTVYLHHDRCVDEKTQMDLLSKLKYFPQDLRMMCLIIWAAGIRANEVCSLKGDAFSFDGEDAFLALTQYKMVSDKKIPIPYSLYVMMTGYIRERGIGGREYIFKSRKGRAYDVATFCRQVQLLCRKYEVGGEGYIFRTHDFRHQVATDLYEAGISLQAIRDYHGHRDENMTRQYVDYIPDKVEQKSRDYFSNHSFFTREDEFD